MKLWLQGNLLKKFNQTLDNPYAQGETPESGGDVGGYNVTWMDPRVTFLN